MKRIATVLAAVLVAASAHAQMGIIAGVTSTSTDFKTAFSDIKNQTVTLYHAGIVYKIGLPLGLAIQPGVIYNMKGEALSDQIATKKVNITTETGYLEVPIQLQWGINIGNILRPYAFVEPYAGYAITTESKAEAQNALEQTVIDALGAINTSNSDENKWDGRERLEYGVGAGVGLQIGSLLGISAKYYWDMGKMYNEDGKASISAQAMYEATKNEPCSGIVASLTLYF